MRKDKKSLKQKILSLAFGFVLIMVALHLTTKLNQAAPLTQNPEPTPEVKDCVECHLDVAKNWSHSKHAQAYENDHFQDHWQEMEKPSNCLSCHTTNYLAATGEFSEEGVTCTACHGPGGDDHPPEPIPVYSGAEDCGKCHMKTLGELRLSGHLKEDLSCTTCHDPHRQEVLFENRDDLCQECHETDSPEMAEHPDVLENIAKIGCVDCHTIAIPHPFQQNHQELSPFYQGIDCDGIVHDFTVDRIDINEHASEILMPEYRFIWPIVHTVTNENYTLECRDCHDSEESSLIFSKLGYPSERVEELVWNKYPEITEEQMSILVAQPKINPGWIGWLIGVASLIIISEITVTRKLKDDFSPTDKDEKSELDG